MKNRQEIILILKRLKGYLRRRYKVKEVGIFGSLIKGHHTPKSDIDILVDFEHGADFLNLVGLSLYLEEKLNRRVDVVLKRVLREEIKDSVLKAIVFV